VSVELLEAFLPFGSPRATLLILGSMPGRASLAENEYYAHPRNAFWPVLQSLFGGSINTYDEKLEILLCNRIVVWDVLERCSRKGSLDANIRKDSIVCNDFSTFFRAQSEISRIGFNGRASEQLFKRHVLPKVESHPNLNFNSLSSPVSPLTSGNVIQLVGLPSTSPAMAAMRVDEKIDSWRNALVPDFHSKKPITDNQV